MMNLFLKASLFAVVVSAMVIATIAACVHKESGTIAYVNDTEYIIAFKLVDGTWDTLSRRLPSTARFDIDSEDGTYNLHCWRSDKDHWGTSLKNAVIDYRILSTQMVLDTVPKRVDR